MLFLTLLIDNNNNNNNSNNNHFKHFTTHNHRSIILSSVDVDRNPISESAPRFDSLGIKGSESSSPTTKTTNDDDDSHDSDIKKAIIN